MDKPLVSFVLTCYNQERFIRDAVEGAFSQTYSPLQIIISDDCSKDRTFEIVHDMVASYKGPHTIRLNRNLNNLGIGGNNNRAVALCQGELIVGAAGDDVSVPERTSTIIQAWNDSGRQATSLYSRHDVIDEHGRSLEGWSEGFIGEPQGRFEHQKGTIANFARRRQPSVRGSTHAFSNKLMSVFGPLSESVTYEDIALSFRTVLVGGLFTFINEPLVKYRRHSQNITFALHLSRPQNAAEFESYQAKRSIELDRCIAAYQCFAADAERAFQKGLISAVDYPFYKNMILRERRRFELKRELLVQPWVRRLCIFWQLFSNTLRPRECIEYTPYLLPNIFYRYAVTTWNRARRSQKTRRR